MPGTTTTFADRYVLERVVADGGLATVWQARDEVLARSVAVKVLRSELAEDEAVLALFRREAHAAAKLSHQNIVAVYDTGSETPEEGPPAHYIVMEYCGGGTLADLVGDGALEPQLVAMVGMAVCDALEHAHRCGIVHGDVNPRNILLTDERRPAGTGSIKVGDFGIGKAAFASGDVSTTGKLLGSLEYTSPEQAAGDEATTATDIYALGVVLYELGTGRVPFSKPSEVETALAHINEEPMPPRALRPTMPRALEQVILTALSKDPAQRFASAAEMRGALRAAVGAERSDTEVIDDPPPPREGFSARRLAPVAMIAVGVIAAAVGVAELVGDTRAAPEPRTADAPTKPTGGPTRARIESATDFDPDGGDGEHPSEVPLAWDEDPATAWMTSTYASTLQAQGKDGVGLLFDLGASKEIARVKITFDRAGYAFELRAGDDAAATEDGFRRLASISAAGASETLAVGESARYWLVWITGFPGGGSGRAAIAEVDFFTDA